MLKVGVVQSFVIEGYVGSNAAVPAIQLLGGIPLVVPTVIYTTHAGVPGARHALVPPQILEFGISHLLAGEPAVIIIGYLPSFESVEIIARKLHKTTVPVLVDPIMGDYPKGLYVPKEVAAGIGKLLVPPATIITPNKFEAEYLTGQTIDSLDSALEAAKKLRALGPQIILIKSLWTERDGRLVSLLIADQTKALISNPYIETTASHGAGDMLNAIMATLMAQDLPPIISAGVAAAAVTRAVEHNLANGGGTVNPVDGILSLGLRQDNKMIDLIRIMQTVGVEIKYL